MKRTITILLALLIAGACWGSYEGLKYLVPDHLLKGWTPVKDSITYGQGSGITAIYNGGYEVYTKAGVLEALRRMYEQKGLYAEVTVHRMKSSDAARAFLAARYKTETHLKAPSSKTFRRFTVSGSGSVTAYSVEGVWFLTIGVFESSDKGKRAAADMLTALEKRAAATK